MENLYWDDIDRGDDPDYDRKANELIREERMKNEGCVVRALSSVIQTKLSRRQEDLRLTQKDKYQSDLIYAMMDKRERGEVVGELKDEFMMMVKEEQRRIIDYITTIQSEIDTPAGSELAKYKFGYKSLTVDEIKKECGSGNKVIWAELYHAAHVQLMDNGTFISLSDGGIPFPLNPKSKHDVIVFERVDG